MIAIADILQAGEKLTAVAPFLAGIQNEEQYTQVIRHEINEGGSVR
ncbi:antitoxin of the HigB-HigA toxin-antitoxin system [Escherichia coli]|nr:antitoxin of the HigB-HigA toxin-antitoxin system [Escherichia coli]